MEDSESRECGMAIPQSTFHKAVYLQDWWLLRSQIPFQGKTLAVAGLTSEQPKRVFSSAPIIKRHDPFTVETADGITVLLQGIINRFRVSKNDFDAEVSSQFMLGFPYNWEDFDDPRPEKEFNGGGSSCISSSLSDKQHNLEHCGSDRHENSVQRGDFKATQCYSWKKTRIRRHEETLLLCDGECSSDVGLDGVVHGVLPLASKPRDISETSSHNTSKFVDNPAVPSKAESIVACSVKSDEGNAAIVNISENLENWKGKYLISESGVNNGSGDSIIIPQAVENSTSKHQAHGCASNKSDKRKSKEILCSLRTTRSSSLNALKNAINMLESKNEKLKNVSFDSDVPYTISTHNGIIQKQNSENATNATKSRKQRKPSRSSVLPDESNSKNNVKISVERGKTHNTERGLSQKRRKYKLIDVTDVTTPGRTCSSHKSISAVSPVSVSYKQSRFGRVLVPPLEFWRNEQVVYDTDGQIIGVMMHCGRIS